MAWHKLRAAPNSGQMGYCYLVCYRYKDGSKAWYTADNGQRCGHYRGWELEEDERVSKHRAGNGSRLCSVVRAADPDVEFWLAERHRGDRNEERRLKNMGGATRWCPLCRQDRLVDALVSEVENFANGSLARLNCAAEFIRTTSILG